MSRFFGGKVGVVVGRKVGRNQVVLVDAKDWRVGVAGIEEAHKGSGKLHRAVSVMLYDGGGKVLVQKRAGGKLLWPGCWSNTVCTHRNYGRDVLVWAKERLKYELGVGMKKKDLRELYRFEYRARYSDEWSEWEVDHVVVGKYPSASLGQSSSAGSRQKLTRLAERAGQVRPDPSEVMDFKWVAWNELREDMEVNPDSYTPWFKLMVDSGQLDRLVEG